MAILLYCHQGAGNLRRNLVDLERRTSHGIQDTLEVQIAHERLVLAADRTSEVGELQTEDRDDRDVAGRIRHRVAGRGVGVRVEGVHCRHSTLEVGGELALHVEFAPAHANDVDGGIAPNVVVQGTVDTLDRHVGRRDDGVVHHERADIAGQASERLVRHRSVVSATGDGGVGGNDRIHAEELHVTGNDLLGLTVERHRVRDHADIAEEPFGRDIGVVLLDGVGRHGRTIPHHRSVDGEVGSAVRNRSSVHGDAGSTAADRRHTNQVLRRADRDTDPLADCDSGERGASAGSDDVGGGGACLGDDGEWGTERATHLANEQTVKIAEDEVPTEATLRDQRRHDKAAEIAVVTDRVFLDNVLLLGQRGAADVDLLVRARRCSARNTFRLVSDLDAIAVGHDKLPRLN